MPHETEFRLNEPLLYRHGFYDHLHAALFLSFLPLPAGRIFYAQTLGVLSLQVSVISSFLSRQPRNEIQRRLQEMAWNNGLERNIFDEEQKRLAAEYRDAGMTEEQIEQMYQFDLDAFNSTRRFFEHNQQIPDNIFGTDDEGLCPLNDKFLEVMSVTKEQSDVKSRYWWIEEIEDPQLAQKVRALPEKDIELITLIAFENYTHKEASVLFGVTRSGVTKRVEQLRKYFQKNS